MSIISYTNIKNRNNIKVYNYSPSRVCMKGATREFDFLGAKDGVPSMIPMSFIDIEYANSKNPDMFVTGILTFDEPERDELYNALNFSNWQERFWTEDSIENAILYPTKAKMDRILAVRDVLTIERIRGIMTKLVNTSLRRPIDNVVFLVNGRWQEILRGHKQSKLEVFLPEDADDKEKQQLKKKNDEMEEKLREMEKKIEALMAAQARTNSVAEKENPVEQKKPAGRPKKTT